MITGIGHIAITCQDIDKSLDFYTRILGLPEAFRMNNDDGSLWMVYLKTGSGGFIELLSRRLGIDACLWNPFDSELCHMSEQYKDF